MRWQVTGAVGVGLLGVPLLRLLWTGPAPPLLQAVDPSPVPVPHTPSQAALHESAFWRVRAIQLADDECDDARAALSAWDPAAAFDPKEARRQFLAGDRAGYLGRARQAAQRAAALAQTPRERYRSDRELRQVKDAAGLGAGLTGGGLSGATIR
jgi:hypothetical protein